MSGVPERQRNLSSLEFYNTAIELRVEVLSVITSSAIPKSRRFTFAVPMAETARNVVYNIVKGQAFYPSSIENVKARKRYYTLAIADCEQLYQDAQTYLELYRRKGDGQHAATFARMAELVDREVALLKGARERHRMKAHACMVAEGEMTVAQARGSYMSWRGGLVKKHGDGKPRFRMDVWHTVRSFDALFLALFGEPALPKERTNDGKTRDRGGDLRPQELARADGLHGAQARGRGTLR